jgi:hypothetical protein
MIGFEFIGDIVVGSSDCMGAVPCAAICIVGQDVGQRGVGGVSAGERLGLQNGGAYEWMTELHVPVVQLHEAGRRGGFERVDVGLGASEYRRRGEDLRQVVERIDRGDQDRVACVLRKLGQATSERSLEASSQRECRCAH